MIDRPYEAIAHPLDGAHVLVKHVKKIHGIEAVPLNEAAERLNDSLHQAARIEALEKAARGVVEARGIGFMQVHKEDVPEFMHLMNRIDKLAALLEQEGGE